jgi:hypothetical protein
VRAWTLALAGWGLAVAAGSRGVDLGFGPIELLLAPAAVGLALAAGLGVAAFETDLPAYRFGWRQVASAVAGVALGVGALPVIGAAVDGRWDSPPRDVTDVLAFLDTEQEVVGAFRTLWLGDPAVLPAGGWELEPGVEWALTDEGSPTILDRWVGSPDQTTLLVSDAVQLAADGETSRLGRLLAPMGVRYLVVVEADRPVVGPEVPAPPALTEALGEQLDLAPVEVDEGLHLFRNAAWLPTRAAVASPDQLVEPADSVEHTAVLGDRDRVDRYEGEVPSGAVWTSTKAADGWHLSVGGRDATAFEGFGWGTAFVVDDGGAAVLEYRTPLSRLALTGVQAGLWGGALYVLRAERRRRSHG